MKAWGIRKNNCYADADFILATLKRIGYNIDRYLVLSGGILLDLREVQRYLERKRKSRTGSELPPRAQHLIFVPLPFTFSRLTDLEFFKGFQRLLWYTSVHFGSCFDTGIWTTDDRGVYCRSEVLRSGLTNLSRLHNMLCDALKHLRRGDHDRWWAGVRTAFDLNRAVVQTHHHRQFPDLLAIALLFERHGKSDVRTLMAKDLYNWAELDLPHNDPRRNMFQELIKLPFDSSGHLYLAFDACCRHLWMARAAGNDYIKAYYAYNQASLPRTSQGSFYELYEGKTHDEIDSTLRQVDEKFTVLDHERICLWHTAIRYLLQEQRYHEAKAIGDDLVSSLIRLDGPLQFFQQRPLNQQRQLNLDTALTYFLLGSAQDSMGQPWEAKDSFETCVQIRSELVLGSVWDPTLAGALERLVSLANRISESLTQNSCKERLDVMYSAMEKDDLTNQLQYSSETAPQEWIRRKARGKLLSLS